MDGFDLIAENSREGELRKILTEYEEKIGNRVLGNFEYTQFDWIVQLSVNDYLALKTEDKTFKCKGDFEYTKELHKNSSFSIIPLTLQKYFIENIEPELFINSHNNIFDFCARSNVGSTYYHEGYSDISVIKLPKLIRYFVSLNGIRIKKVVRENCDTGANDVNIQPADMLKKVCNRIENERSYLDEVNRKWYIDKVREIIYKINTGKKPKIQKVSENQMSLF